MPYASDTKPSEFYRDLLPVAQDYEEVTPSDETVLGFDALWVGGAGNVAITSMTGNTVTLVGVTAGELLPVAGTKVMSTNTTATSIVALKMSW